MKKSAAIKFSLTKSKKLPVSISIKDNLTILGSKLVHKQENDSFSSISCSDDDLSQTPLEQSDKINFQLIQEIVNNFDNYAKCLLFYSKLMERNQMLLSTYRQNENNLVQIFKGTTFHPNLHKMLTKYLIQKIKYNELSQKSIKNKLVDVFYKFINNEDQGVTIQLIWRFLRENRQYGCQTIGQWFKIQGFESLLRNFIKDKKEYTKFIINLMKYGMGYLFVCCSKIIKKQSIEKITEIQIEVINLSTISKLNF